MNQRARFNLLLFSLLFLPALGCLVLTACFSWPWESPAVVKEVALADLDGDGFVDAVLANGRFGEPYTYPSELRYQILYNDGTGRFNRDGRVSEQWNHNFVALGDLNGSGVADALLGSGAPVVLFNDGAGALQRAFPLRAGVMFSGFEGGAALADLDGDGSLDIFLANCCGGVSYNYPETPRLLPPHNVVFLNDGSGRFAVTEQLLGVSGSHAVALGDLNGDGFLDAFVVNGQTQVDADRGIVFKTPNTVWFNRGDSRFDDSGQQLGREDSRAVALGDVNGDGFLDAVVGNEGADEIWLNDGRGFFSLDGQRPGSGLTKGIFLADLDGDGDLDLVTAGETAVRVWFNDGSGVFTAARQTIPVGKHHAVALADLDNDGAMDIFEAGINSYNAWFNDGSGRFTRR